MAEIIQDEGAGKKKGKRRAKKHSTHIDMTPMVDLACLLLTFFMLTTAFSKPKVMEIILPEKNNVPKNQPEVAGWRVLNIILTDNDKVLWYNGKIDPKKPLPVLTETDFSKDGIRKVLLQRNKALFERIDSLNTGVTEGKIELPRDSVSAEIKRMKKEDKVGPIVLIKADENVKYGDFVDIIDEMAICNIARYSIVDLNSYEKKMIADYKAGKSGTAPATK